MLARQTDWPGRASLTSDLQLPAVIILRSSEEDGLVPVVTDLSRLSRLCQPSREKTRAKAAVCGVQLLQPRLLQHLLQLQVGRLVCGLTSPSDEIFSGPRSQSGPAVGCGQILERGVSSEAEQEILSLHNDLRQSSPLHVEESSQKLLR